MDKTDKKKKRIKIILIAIAVYFLIGVFVYILIGGNLTKETTPKFTINYFDGGIPGNNYDIYIYDNMDIKVVKHPGCSTADCAQGKYKPSDVVYNVEFSDDLNEKIKSKYFPIIFKYSNNIKVSNEELNEESSKFIFAIIYKDESNL